MQDYISDPRNKEKISRIKLALTYLEAADVAGQEIEVDSLNGCVRRTILWSRRSPNVGKKSRLDSRLVYKTSV